jgi:hypothetical protein
LCEAKVQIEWRSGLKSAPAGNSTKPLIVTSWTEPLK